MEITREEAVRQFLRELGEHVNRDATLVIDGSVALILAGLIQRRTEDIDVVDELPPGLRDEHELLRTLAGRYGLILQSHYLPAGWEQRVTSMGQFGKLRVMVADIYMMYWPAKSSALARRIWMTSARPSPESTVKPFFYESSKRVAHSFKTRNFKRRPSATGMWFLARI